MELRIQQWMPIFKAQAESGLNKKDWCQKNGIHRWEFYQRQRECREYLMGEKEPPACEPSEFVELPVRPVSPGTERSDEVAANGVVPCNNSLTMECGSFKLELTGAISGEMMATIIKAVANA